MNQEDDFADIDVVIEFVVKDEGTTESIKNAFPDDEVLESHAFGGMDVVTVLTTLSKSTIGRLIELFAAKAMETPKTTLKIGKEEIVFANYSREDVEALLASPHFLDIVRATKKK